MCPCYWLLQCLRYSLVFPGLEFEVIYGLSKESNTEQPTVLVFKQQAVTKDVILTSQALTYYTSTGAVFNIPGSEAPPLELSLLNFPDPKKYQNINSTDLAPHITIVLVAECCQTLTAIFQLIV